MEFFLLVVLRDLQEKKARLVLAQCSIFPIHTFMEYIKNGTQIHCCFAIDFTASNGDPNDGNSLHHFSAATNHTSPNPYEQAIQAVGDIIQDYDQTKRFAVFGFGARVPPAGTVSHNFYVTMDQASPYCDGITGVLEAYRYVKKVIFLNHPMLSLHEYAQAKALTQSSDAYTSANMCWTR